ncbi:MAG: hypothetical protein R3D99_11520 [Altererythrobacter sp.]
MKKIYGFGDNLAGMLRGNTIITRHGGTLTVDAGELHDAEEGHVGYFDGCEVRNYHGELQGSLEKGWEAQ